MNVKKILIGRMSLWMRTVMFGEHVDAFIEVDVLHVLDCPGDFDYGHGGMLA